MDLSVAESAVDSWAVVEVRGEVDVHSAPELLKRLTKVLDANAKFVIVDLNGIAFIDSTGLGTLVAARNQAASMGAALRVVCHTDRVLKLFRITGLHDVFSIFATVDEAVATPGDASTS